MLCRRRPCATVGAGSGHGRQTKVVKRQLAGGRLIDENRGKVVGQGDRTLLEELAGTNQTGAVCDAEQ
jgi:hypothetical protein